MDYIEIFDTTMRDGEQSPGATMTSTEKLRVAQALARLGVDMMEAGFPAASPDDLAAVRQVAQEVCAAPGFGRAKPPGVCALARATERDIDKAAQAIEPAQRGRIHIFLATSPIHREHKLRMSKSEVVDTAHRMIAYAQQRCTEVEFSAEDATRTEPEFLHEVFAAAVSAGATYLNVPDTVGYSHPFEYAHIVRELKQKLPGIENVVLSVHCHNDLGLAVANTLAGITAGARQAEVTINGIGERAGNAALEELVMALRTRQDIFQVQTGIDTTQLAPLSKLVSRVTGMTVQPNKAIVGKNAFAHEAGIHQDGMLKARQTYEIMTPETVGVASSTLVLGKHSGRAAIKARLAELGFTVDDAAMGEIFAAFKALAEQSKHVTDDELIGLMNRRAREAEDRFELVDVRVTSSTKDLATAAVSVRRPGGEVQTQAAVGNGPIDATFNAIDSIVGSEAELVDYQLAAEAEGHDADGRATVHIRTPEQTVIGAASTVPQARTFRGTGRDRDVVTASALAYIEAQNSWCREHHPRVQAAGKSA